MFPGAIAIMFDGVEALMASVGGAGAIAAGEPAEDGVDTAGEAMLTNCNVDFQIRLVAFMEHSMSISTPSIGNRRLQEYCNA